MKHSRKPLEYGPNAAPVWYMTDACINGIAGVIAQGQDWKSSRVAAFFSAKMTSAQQNYPVHEQEMLAGVEGMLRYRDVLQGAKFTWLIDHKGLIHLYGQMNLSGRQVRWLEKISKFDFDIRYVPGVENILPDALSHVYSADAPGTVRAPSEYTQFADHGITATMVGLVSMPVFIGIEAIAGASPLCCSNRQNKGVPRVRLDPSVVEHISKRRAGDLAVAPASMSTTAPAETPVEVSKEFARRMASKIMIHGP